MSREGRLSRVFVELADTLVDDFDALDILHLLTERCVELLEIDAAGIILSDQRGGLQSIASTTHEVGLIEIFVLQNSEGPCLDCFRSGDPIVNITFEESQRRWPMFTAASTALGYRTTHALPLRLRNEVIGAMNFFSVGETELNTEDLALGQALADVSTIALLQARAVHEKDLLAEQLQYALNSRVLVEQAKGVLAERFKIDVEEAFTHLRSFSRRHRVPLSEVASRVIAGTLTVADLER
ncbi:GAF domain-containing protein [Nocardioides ginsengisegetis]|uniref:GAF domain-containing protein n=2 Tax=Nocardioides TaxID=1839 RepID=A0A7W3J331_9ACTN|nr:GAF and ANTAR domain-containing protein [Nocardioides ginsengisegetis]MBA8805426.1 GAF domain-containing protein [Nocardioides ginsengisegetis]